MRHPTRSILARLSAALLLVVCALVLFFPEENQPGLTLVLVSFSLVFAFSWCLPPPTRELNGEVDWCHPSTLFLLCYLIYFIMPGVWLCLGRGYDPMWVNLGHEPATVVNTVFFLGAASVATFGLGIRSKMPFPGKAIYRFLCPAERFRKKEMRYLILFFVVVGAGVNLYHASLKGPLTINFLLYLSPTYDTDLGIRVSQFTVMLESMLQWGVLLAAFAYLVRYSETGKQKGRNTILLLLLIVAVALYMKTGKRHEVFVLLLFPFVWRHYLVKRTSTIQVGTYGIVATAVLVGLLMIRILVPLFLKGVEDPRVTIGDDVGELVAFYLDSGEFGTFEMITGSLVERDELLARAGGTILGFLNYSFSTLLVFIPRAIWPGKPGYEDLGRVFYQTFTGSSADVGFAVTIWGSSILFFHVPGLLFSTWFLGWFLNGIYQMLRPWEGKPSAVFYYAIFFWMGFHFIRFGTLGFTFLLFVQSMLVGALGGRFLGRKQGRPRNFGHYVKVAPAPLLRERSNDETT